MSKRWRTQVTSKSTRISAGKGNTTEKNGGDHGPDQFSGGHGEVAQSQGSDGGEPTDHYSTDLDRRSRSPTGNDARVHVSNGDRSVMDAAVRTIPATTTAGAVMVSSALSSHGMQ